MLIWKAARQNLGNTSPFFFYTLASLFICNMYHILYTSIISIVFLNLNIHIPLFVLFSIQVFFVYFCRKTNLVKKGFRFCHSKDMVNFGDHPNNNNNYTETFPAPFLPLTQVFPRRHFPSCNDPIHCCKRYTLTAFTVSLFIFELSISRTKASIRNRFFFESYTLLYNEIPPSCYLINTSNDFLYLE